VKAPIIKYVPPRSIRRRLVYMSEVLNTWGAAHCRQFPWRRQLTPDPYRSVVVEILLQRTTASKVAEYYDTFFTRFPDWQALAGAERKGLEGCLEPLGLHVRRSVVLNRLGLAMMRRKGRLPHTRESLESLPGVGQYVASAVLLCVFGRPEPLIDTNMVRILERVFGPRRLADIRHDPVVQRRARYLVRASANPLLTNFAVLDLAAAVCRPGRPECSQCPVVDICDYARRSATTVWNSLTRDRRPVPVVRGVEVVNRKKSRDNSVDGFRGQGRRGRTSNTRRTRVAVTRPYRSLAAFRSSSRRRRATACSSSSFWMLRPSTTTAVPLYSPAAT